MYVILTFPDNHYQGRHNISRTILFTNVHLSQAGEVVRPRRKYMTTKCMTYVFVRKTPPKFTSIVVSTCNTATACLSQTNINHHGNYFHAA